MKSYEARTLKQLQQCVIDGEPYELHLFWKSHLGQWTRSPFTVDGVTYATAEHWMMAGKAKLFNDDESFEAIIAELSPKLVKDIGRGVKGFDPDVWNTNCSEIVTQGNVHKFSQYPLMKQMLMATGTKVLVEASPYDAVWGIALGEDNPDAQDPLKWKGSNLLGFALMETRKRLST